MTSITIRVEPPAQPGIHVGFYETESRGTTEGWRSVGWMAAILASLETGSHLEAYVPSFTVEGRIDGPSAGALMAAGLMAALRGDELRPDATMTGMIGPDGTVLPVGGVPDKAEAVARAGYRLMLVPEGQAAGSATGQETGAAFRPRFEPPQTREVATIREAYALLTGRTPQSPGLSPPDPTLAGGIEDRLCVMAGEWLTRYREELAHCQRLQNRAARGARAAEGLEEAERTAALSRTSLARGDMAAAYDQALLAALQSTVAAERLEAARALAKGGFAAVARLLGDPTTSEQTDVAAFATGSAPAATADDMVAVADALGVVVQGAGVDLASRGLAQDLQASVRDRSAKAALGRAAVLMALGRHAPQIAKDRLELLTHSDRRPAGQAASLAAWAATMDRGSSASLAYLEAVTVDETARELGLHPERLRAALQSQDLTYLLAQASLTALPDVLETVPSGRPPDLATLGGAVGTYTAASAVLAKLYAFRAVVSEQGAMSTAEDSAGLSGMLDRSAVAAADYIEMARDAGLEANIPAFYYAIARWHSEGSDQQKIEALQAYWQASLYARLSVLLTTQGPASD